MKNSLKITIISIIVLVVTLSFTTPIFAEGTEEFTDNIAQDSHKILNKWDLTGTFISIRPWGSIIPVGSTWSYEVHIKEAKDGEKSVGVVKLMSGDVEVTGHVKATKVDYLYWSDPPPGYPSDIEHNLAAVGWAEYNDMKYNFMFLYSEGAIWIALSDQPYDAEWADNTVWQTGRAYDLLSQCIPDTYPFDEKEIH